MRFGLLVIVACGCLWLLPGQAAAAHVNCGETLTAETVLDSDVVCSETDTAGLIIGGDDFTLWLGHHQIVGPGVTVAGSDGVRDDGTAHSGVTIRGGTITGFEEGVDLDADDSAVKGLQIQAGSTGIAIRGARNYVYRNTTDFAGFTGIEAIGDDTELWGNKVLGTTDDGIVVDGDNPRVLVNSVQGCLFDGVIVTGYSAGLVALNTVTGCDIGFSPSGRGLKLQSNQANNNCIGIFVDDPAALVRWNTANDNCSEGIIVGQAGALLKKNTANNNVDFGIDAVEGTIDAGGNTATGNGEDCLGVVCVAGP